MNYSPVSGWMLDYFYKFATGTFKSGMNSEQVSGVFNDLMTSPVEMIIWLAIIVVFGFFVCSRGLQKGIEKVSKVMMVALLALIVILAINSMMLSNAGEGLSFYLVPDFGKVKDVGLGKVITSAMSQAFFTLGLGIASMEIFGSYMNKDRTLYGEAVQICALDTFVAIVLPCLLFIWRSARPRTCPYFCDASERFRKYDGRSDLGYAFLSVYDICKLFNGYCRV